MPWNSKLLWEREEIKFKKPRWEHGQVITLHPAGLLLHRLENQRSCRCLRRTLIFLNIYNSLLCMQSKTGRGNRKCKSSSKYMCQGDAGCPAQEPVGQQRGANFQGMLVPQNHKRGWISGAGLALMVNGRSGSGVTKWRLVRTRRCVSPLFFQARELCP